MQRAHVSLLLGLCATLSACDSTSTGAPTAPVSPAVTSIDPQRAAGPLAASNTWTPKHSMRTPRSQSKAAALNSIIYVVGGRTSTGPRATVEAYSVNTDTWTARKSLPSARTALNGASSINGRIYVTGGFNSSFALTSTLFVYDPAANTWTKRANMPKAGACGAQGVIAGLLYVYLGCTNVPFGDKLFRYDPGTNTWVTLADPPAQHANGAAGVISGKLFLGDGSDDGAQSNLTMHAFTPASNTWATKASLPGVQSNPATTVIAGKLYVGGGSDDVGTTVGTLTAYTGSTNSWAPQASMPTARYDGAGVASGGLFFVIGGTDVNGTVTGAVEAYTP
jgi:N-acetylneuraminic acid mutarotase